MLAPISPTREGVALLNRGLLALLGALTVLALVATGASAKPFHILLPDHFAQPPTTAQCLAAYDNEVACYGVPQIQRAYDMQPLYNAGLNGAGKTIIVVDAFGSPTIQQDLQTFDQAYGLPAPPSLQVVTPDGPVNQNDPAAPSWGFETTLDVEWSHAMAPGANILLVETPVAETEGITGFPQIVAAENSVIDQHMGDVITQSFGATEQTFDSPQQLESQRSAYFNALVHHVTVLASSGDTGATNYELDGVDFYPFPVVGWPASDPLVTGVGGTEVHLDSSGNRAQPDNVWNDPALPAFGLVPPAAGSGGLSSVFSRPFYQDRVSRQVGRQRGIPDVSLNAACSSAVNVYLSFDQNIIAPGWYQICGTSEASPLFSGMVAIADQAAHHDLGLLNPQLYAIGDRFGSGLVDITRGNNTVTFVQPSTQQTITVQGYDAVRGYDLASGLGTPDGALLVAELAGYRIDHHRR
jgi:subtilase family serine protease